MTHSVNPAVSLCPPACSRMHILQWCTQSSGIGHMGKASDATCTWKPMESKSFRLSDARVDRRECRVADSSTVCLFRFPASSTLLSRMLMISPTRTPQAPQHSSVVCHPFSGTPAALTALPCTPTTCAGLLWGSVSGFMVLYVLVDTWQTQGISQPSRGDASCNELAGTWLRALHGPPLCSQAQA